MREIEVRGLAYIPLGRQGENGAQKVVWPGIADSWARLYGNGVFALAVLRQGDSAPYPASITSENGDIVWVLSSADTAKPGEGMAELTYTVCGVIARSRTWRTVVERSLSADGTSEPPEAYQSWVDEVLTAAAGVETAVNKMPYIDTDTGNWFKWDAKSNAFADTGVSAQGPKGDTGPAGASGAKGDPGPKGDPGEKGEKGDTGATGAAGAKGETGATGPAGANGRDGAPGPKGETGPAGPKGDPGEKGEKGDTGATGPQGEPGPAGKDGITPEIVEGELVTVPSAGGGADPSLGITGASIDQIIKVKAVDTEGKPTAWEPVDMPGAEKWELIEVIPLTAGVALYDIADFSVYRKIAISMVKPATTDGSGTVFLRIYKLSDASAPPATYIIDGSWVKASRGYIELVKDEPFLQYVQLYRNNEMTPGTGGASIPKDNLDLTDLGAVKIALPEAYSQNFDGTGTMTIRGIR